MTRYLLLALAAGGMALWGTSANANEPSAKPALASNSAVPIQQAIRVVDNGNADVDATQVQWRRGYGRSYYGWHRPYYGGYHSYYRPYYYGGYRGYYRPYYGGWGYGYPYGGYGSYYRGWNPYWGGGWGGYYRPRSGIWFGFGL